MLSIDENILIRDLYYTRNELLLNPNKNMVKYDYPNFCVLNGILANTKSKMFTKITPYNNEKKTDALLDDLINKKVNDFINKANNYDELFYDLFRNAYAYLKSIRYKLIPCFDCNREYSEKEFIDIILSFYSQYGDKYYNIVKKYFDEKRIHFDYVDKSSDTNKDIGGFFTSLNWLNSGYIVAMFNKYSSVSMTALTHELGHAIDAETYRFPQQKVMNIFSDLLIEVPSTTFEFAMYDYLKKNKIDVDAPLVMYNNRFQVINAAYETLKKSNSRETFINLEGNLLVPETDTIKKEDIKYNDEGEIIVKTGEYKLDNLFFDKDGNLIVNKHLELPYRDDIIYSLGYLFALHLNQIKDLSTKEFLKVFNNLITSRKEANIEECIEMMGISVDDFVSGKLIREKIKGETKELKKRFNVYS